jgi:Undecaprenyl-phosphate galactose phosphotransferase WbaP
MNETGPLYLPHDTVMNFNRSANIRVLPTGASAPSDDSMPLRHRRTIILCGLILSDIVALNVALVLGFATRLVISSIWTPIDISLAHYLSLAASLLPIPFIFNLNNPDLSSPVYRFRQRVLIVLLTFMLLMLWDLVAINGTWSHGVILCTLPFALTMPPFFFAVARSALDRFGLWGMPTVILGAGESGLRTLRTLTKNPEIGLRPIAFFDDDPRKLGEVMDGVPVVGALRDVAAWSGRADTCILSIPSASPRLFSTILAKVRFRHVIVIPEIAIDQGAAVQSVGVQPRDLGGLIGLELNQNLQMLRSQVMKRLIDLAISLPVFLLTLPVLLVSAICIVIVSPGPAFFGHLRAGKNGRQFRMWKLRTMYPNAEARLSSYLTQNPSARAEWERHFKLRKDPRVLPAIGAFLRKTSIDELPQLWNVIRGNMSLVGPRPFPTYHLEHFTPSFQALRTHVAPGITGLWQTSARSDGDLRDQEFHDTFYIRNWSPWLDLYILSRTAYAVLTAKGAF